MAFFGVRAEQFGKYIELQLKTSTDNFLHLNCTGGLDNVKHTHNYISISTIKNCVQNGFVHAELFCIKVENSILHNSHQYSLSDVKLAAVGVRTSE